MPRTRLVFAIGVSVWSALLSGSQAGSSAALPSALRAHLTDEPFGIVTSVRGLPLGVRDELRTLFGMATLEIADPGDATGAPNLPIRRLVAAGCARDNHCLVHYERGGAARAWPVALFHWTPATTRLEWGGTAAGPLANIEDVRKAILAGAIKGANTVW